MLHKRGMISTQQISLSNKKRCFVFSNSLLNEMIYNPDNEIPGAINSTVQKNTDRRSGGCYGLIALALLSSVLATSSPATVI